MMKASKSATGWLILLNAFYALAALVGWPVYLVLLALRPKYRRRCWERWGFVPRLPPAAERFWVHAISVGEVEAARTFVPALAEAFPDADIVLSTTTRTGRERAERLFSGRRIFHFPLDLAPCVLLALHRIRPTAILQVESEWWPNFFLLARRRGLPVFVVNLRMTERSHRRYLRIRGLMRAVVSTCAAVATQAPVYTERLVGLGADPERVRVTGQMKHDAVEFADAVPGAEDLRRESSLEPGAPVLVAGSTAPGEEAILLEAFRAVRERRPAARLVIVPRRPENFDAAAAVILIAGFSVLRRSTGETTGPTPPAPVILGDTMGDLMKWYALADVVIVGRSFAPLGGSNPMEPGSLAKPLVWGPHMFNFAVEAREMLSAGAARQAADLPALAQALEELLTHADRRREMGEAARTVIRRLQGATRRNVDLVRETLAAKEPQ
ncbi:MAG TPA: 3-deoxy-D-manno-octulosonic acid transferase [Phycisphaerae bacterium]|nr:3-deoxy-D-manno-octulosonic acid transferase [Phycisphaerae bacterium]